MKIRIKSKSINNSQINDVINYFNLNKPSKWNNLEKLEGGFKIILKNNTVKSFKLIDNNNKIKQLNQNIYSNQYNNSYEEELLLYRSLQYILGIGEVEII